MGIYQDRRMSPLWALSKDIKMLEFHCRVCDKDLKYWLDEDAINNF